MKSIKFLLSLMSIVLMTLTSCSDDNDVYLSNRKFVRIDQSSVYLTVGEKMKFTATVDDIAGDTYSLRWSVLDPNVATASDMDGNAVSITAVAPGKTIVKVETTDGKLKYFADLTVQDGVKPVRILSIGSGLANDATSSYFFDIVNGAGISMVMGNVYVEGASFEDHVNNLTEKQSVYTYNRTAVDGSVAVQNSQSLKSVISGENWDYIVYEESIANAGIAAGYQSVFPQLMTMVEALATNPEVKYALHQPWAYAKLADDAAFANYERDQLGMYNAIVTAVDAAAAANNISLVIPTGTAIQNGRTSYLGEGMLRDDSHLNADAARFTAACTWYESLFGKSEIAYVPDNLINYDAKLAKNAAHEAVTSASKVTVLENYVDSPARIYVDFGPEVSPDPFNNYRFPTDPGLIDMRDDKGKTTTVCLEVSKPFTGVLERGLENSLGFPRSASADMFFCDGIWIPVAEFKLSGLNKGEKYTFNFYGHINDSGTQTVYTVKGKTEGSASLVNDYNPDRVAAVKSIEPDDDGCIYIEMTFGPDNVQWARFFGINAMVIMSEG